MHTGARSQRSPCRLTSTFAAGRRTSSAINNFDRASATARHRCRRAEPRRNNICRSCSNIFPRARFYFYRRPSGSCLHNGTSRKAHVSAYAAVSQPFTFFSHLRAFASTRDQIIHLNMYCLNEKHRETISVRAWSGNMEMKESPQAITKANLYI